MKKLIVLTALHSPLLFAGQTGGGGGLGKQRPENLMSIAAESLPSISVDSETLRRTEARLSVNGVEAVEMPLECSSVSVRKLSSAVVDADFTRRFVTE